MFDNRKQFGFLFVKKDRPKSTLFFELYDNYSNSKAPVYKL